MLHMVKLAVGIRDVAHLRQVQAMRLATNPPLRHQTRSFPRRAEEITAGGSMYWVIAGAIVVRQRIVDIIEDQWDDGTKCAGLVMDATLVPVAGRQTKAFQGWRYLSAEDAPADIGIRDQEATELPPELRRTLQGLGLL
jgi:hypothetical protein